MNHTIVLDGYNIIFKNPVWRNLSAEAARKKLQLLAENSRYPFTANTIIIVYDAPEPSHINVSHRCAVYYATPSADAFIQKFIRDNAKALRISLITDDGELLRTAKSHAVKHYTAKWFLGLNHPKSSHRLLKSTGKHKKSISLFQKRMINDELKKQWLSDNDEEMG